ncbi:MAG: YbhN family protein [Chloroflexota bacterium]
MTDDRTPGTPARPARPAPDDREVTAAQLSLMARLRQPRTIASLVVPLVIIVLVLLNLPGFQLDRIPGLVLSANPVLLLAAFVVFYLGFPLRGYRWALLIRGTGYHLRVKDATEIIFLSWLVNCLVPAKLGDLYRAWLLKINSDVSLSRTFGTVFIERILDLFAISILGLAAGYWSFRNGLPTQIQIVFGIGVAVVFVLALGLLTMRNFGRRILVRLPVPHTFLEYYDRFEEGVFGAIGLQGLPPLLIITGAIWATEATRLYLVVAALDLPGVSLGISGAFFVALIGSLLTAVPLSPAGLGIVEAGVVGVLTVAYGIPRTEAATIALVDRAISVLSIIVLGAIAYALSGKRRGAGVEGTTSDGSGPDSGDSDRSHAEPGSRADDAAPPQGHPSGSTGRTTG